MVLLPLVVKEGSPVLWEGTSGAGADGGEDDKVCFCPYSKGENRQCYILDDYNCTLYVHHTTTHVPYISVKRPGSNRGWDRIEAGSGIHTLALCSI